MYGTQAFAITAVVILSFENDVKMYGTQANTLKNSNMKVFENDVKMYDIRCSYNRLKLCVSLVKR